MRGPSSVSKRDMAFKRDLLENLLQGLRAARVAACSFDAMTSVEERKRAVKRSADVAMAAARAAAAGGGRARWPKAILAAAAAAGAASSGSSSSPSACKARRSRCRRVVRRCVGAKTMRRGCYAAAGSGAAAPTSSDVARRLVRRRTMALRKVIPGGSAAMDEAALLREAMDYVVHLRAQVDVLRRVSAAVQRSTFPRYAHFTYFTCDVFSRSN